MIETIDNLKLNHIYNMDCLEGLKHIETKSVDVAFTSPPYNRIRNDTYEHYDDTKQDYFQWLVQITDQLLRVTKKRVIVNIQMNHFNKVDVCNFIGKYSGNMQGIIVWEKTNPQPNVNYRDDGTYSVTNAYEFFFVLGQDGKEFRANNKIKNIIKSSVNSQHFKGHGAIMKEEIADWFIKNFSSKDDVVIDPFMGCATTAVSCLKNKRYYIGFEISKEYCDISNERIAKTKEQLRQITMWE